MKPIQDFQKKNTKHPPKNIPVAMKPENKKKTHKNQTFVQKISRKAEFPPECSQANHLNTSGSCLFEEPSPAVMSQEVLRSFEEDFVTGRENGEFCITKHFRYLKWRNSDLL